jgi:ACS family hexuronate transporter-like MFS transporter
MTDVDSPKIKIGNYRWVICALLFFATTINYVDRQVLGILAPDLQKAIGWNEIEYSRIVIAFQFAYAIGLVVFGWFIDLWGTKLCYSGAMIFWSVAAMAHAAVNSVIGFGAARFFLGIGESGNFPAAIKAIAEWFPKKERALATGIFNSGANIGAVVAPAVVPWLTLTFSWRAAFIATGAIGFFWLLFWIPLYSRPELRRRLDPRELDHIQSDGEDAKSEKVSWISLLGYRQTWAFIVGKFMTDPVWWFYLFWLPKWLNKDFKLDLKHVGLPLILVYTMVSVGSIGGGMISSSLLKRGRSVNFSRKMALFICACSVVPIVLVTKAPNVWIAVSLVGLAAAAHAGWSANIFTTVSDMFPKKAVGSVTGLGGMAGSVGAMLFAEVIGKTLERTGNYWVLFLIGATAYLIAFGIIHMLVPRMEPVRFPEKV